MCFALRLVLRSLGCFNGDFVWRPRPGCELGWSGEAVHLSHGFSGQVAFAVIPLSPCDLKRTWLQGLLFVLAGVLHGGGAAEGCPVKSGLWFPVTEFRLDTREGRTVGRHLKISVSLLSSVSVEQMSCSPEQRASLLSPSPVCALFPLGSCPQTLRFLLFSFCPSFWSPWDLKLLLELNSSSSGGPLVAASLPVTSVWGASGAGSGVRPGL